MPGTAAAFVDDRKIGRVQKQKMKGFMADATVKEAAKAHAMKACLCFLRPAFIQFNTVGITVVSLCQLAQSLPAAAARVQQIGGNTLREPDPP